MTGKEKIFDILSQFFGKVSIDYNSVFFLILLAVFFVVYFILCNKKLKEIWILFGSIVFYCWSGWQPLLIVLFTAVVVYVIALKMSKIYEQYDQEAEGLSRKEQGELFLTYKKKTKRYLYVAFLVVFGLWIAVKLCKVSGMASVMTLSEMIQKKGIIVPLGISYYTLSTMGYTLDVFWRKTKPEKNFLHLFTSMIYFPHIVQGPISRYEDLIAQMKNLPGFDYKRVCYGLQLMVWGLFEKMVVADRLVKVTSTIFAKPEKYAGVEILIAVLLSVVWLYADFGGCMDIVRGISSVLGIELERNFNQPFYAESAQEFWSRWHMTLSGWTKSYIYLPIAMNPKFMKWTRKLKKENKAWFSSFIKAFLPLIAVWCFTGLWHGTGVDYLAWGLYWCVVMTISKETEGIMKKLCEKCHIDLSSKGMTWFRRVRTYFIFAIGRMWTACGSLAGCWVLWKQLFAEHRIWKLFDESLFTYGLDRKDFYVAIIGILIMWAVDIMHEHGILIRDSVAKMVLPVRWVLYYAIIFTIIVLGIYGGEFDAASFAYGAF